ncbi:MAG: BtpA/SgcQ family protein [Firmicutes bacterium]|nr:BtpA/SgcQ family protein [Bacillota bacterium]
MDFGKVFGTEKPIIGLVHLPPLPGAPKFEAGTRMKDLVKTAVKDAKALKEAGFDAMIFANEGDYPYSNPVGLETVAAYARIATEVIDKVKMPYGVGCLIDPKATFALARALDAQFVRTYMSGVFASLFGLEVFNPGDIARYIKSIDAGSIPMFLNLTPHAGTSLDKREFLSLIDGALFMLGPEVVLMPGPRAGLPPDLALLKEAKKRYPKVKIMVSSGVTPANVKEALEYGDGILVGTNVKVDGYIFNPIDPARCEALMKAAGR